MELVVRLFINICALEEPFLLPPTSRDLFTGSRSCASELNPANKLRDVSIGGGMGIGYLTIIPSLTFEKPWTLSWNELILA